LLALTADNTVVGEASRDSDVSRLIASFKPNVALLDIQMPGMSGIDVLKFLK
jgi:DNA-binding NarL/FixJ family response regulator